MGINDVGFDERGLPHCRSPLPRAASDRTQDLVLAGDS